MNIELGAITSIPLHPAVVHFPIALLICAAALEAVCLVLRRFLWIDRAATALLTIGGATLGAAYLTGERAADAASPIVGVAQGILADHEDLALLTLWVTAAAVILKVFVTWLGRDDLEVRLGIFRLISLVVVFGSAAMVILTAYHGGQLVYDHGVGVNLG
jgi:uncharacterized membrane protein